MPCIFSAALSCALRYPPTWRVMSHPYSYSSSPMLSVVMLASYGSVLSGSTLLIGCYCVSTGQDQA